MRIYIFKSEASELYACAGDMAGIKLPARIGPWHLEDTIEAGGAMPHNLSRFKIESAIKTPGFQLWRIKRPVLTQK